MIIWTFFFGLSTVPSVGQEVDVTLKKGRSLFRTNCAACHGVHREGIGPMLASITKKRSEAWLTAFVMNSQRVIISGDPYANFLFQQYNQHVMPSFEKKLSDEDVESILYFINKESLIAPKDFDADEAAMQHSTPEILAGKVMFERHCVECHFVHYEDDYGPALGSVSKRLPREWLYSFIRNSQNVIHDGDPYAVQLFEAFDQRVMVAMPFLTNDDIDLILNYIEFVSTSPQPIAGVNGRKVAKANAGYWERVIYPDEKPEKGIKVLFIVVSLIGATIHTFLIVKLFLYLRRSHSS